MNQTRLLLLLLVIAGAAGTLAGAASPAMPSGSQNPLTQGGRGAGPSGGAPTTGTGLLLGQVIDGVSGSPVSEAIVALSGGAGRGATNGQSPNRVMVDGEGRFLFRDLPSGAFTLTATKNGYFGGSSGQRSPTGLSRPIELGDGERLGDVTLRLWPYGSVNGTVLDESSAPVPGLTVDLLRRTAANGRWQFVSAGSTTTDDRGTYRLARVTPGSYVVEARSASVQGEELVMSLLMRDEATLMKLLPKIMERGEESLTIDPNVHLYPATFYPGAPTSAQATEITVAPGEQHADLDFRVRPVAARTVAGTVIGLDSKNTSLSLRLKPMDAAAADNNINVSNTSLTPNGRFVFLGVPPGQYVIEAVSRPQFTGSPMSGGPGRAAGTPAQPPAAPAEPTWCATVPITVGDRSISDVSIALRPGGRVSGRVEFESGGEQPARESWPQITVTLAPLDGSGLNGMVSPGRVESDGTFRTASVAPGRYLLRVGPVGGRGAGPNAAGAAGRGSAITPSAWRPRSAMVDGRDALDQPLEVDAADIDNVIITFTEQKLATLSGTVRNANGAGDAGAVIVLFPTDSRLWTDLSGTSRRIKQARTTRAGSYAIPGLPGGEYFVATGADDLLLTWQGPGALEALSRQATRVQIPDGQSQTLDLKSGGR